MKESGDNYHQKVSDYYNKDVEYGFEARAEENFLLQKIRDDFRKITADYPFENALEIGCGPGFDVAWFAREFPEREITGVDISPRMVELARKRIEASGLENANALVSDEKQLAEHFPNKEFDLIYVFFGALNTVENLDNAAREIHRLLKPGGHAVLTFVNKWYLREMFVQSLKLNFKVAFSRIRKIWGGYSPNRFLPSKCYSPGQILRTFNNFTLLQKRGYSIFFPAWYNFSKFRGRIAKADQLWEKDLKIQNTFLWSKGEYTLFVFRK